MASKLIMSKEEALAASAKLISIKNEHEANISKMMSLMKELKAGWQADSEVAYEECFSSMTTAFNKYSQLLEDYSSTLKRVTLETFNNDSNYANQIYNNFKI